jgi:hypothetical protein
MNKLLRHASGRDRLRETLTPAKAAELVLKLAISHIELTTRADDAERREYVQASRAARDRATVATCVLAEVPSPQLCPILERLKLRS